MIHADEFASYDGKRGNAKGDQVLERVAWVIMATVRTTDVVYRHEASTFCVLLPSTSDGDAVAVADRIQLNVAKMPLLSECGVTIKVGVASGRAGDVKDAVDRAVRALDEAVRTGQPRILNAEKPNAGPSGPAVSPPAPARQHLVESEAAAPVIAAPVPLAAPPAETPFAPPVAAPLDAISPPALHRCPDHQSGAVAVNPTMCVDRSAFAADVRFVISSPVAEVDGPPIDDVVPVDEPHRFMLRDGRIDVCRLEPDLIAHAPV